MLKLLVEFGPIIVFFATYKFSDIFVATMWMLGVTISGLIVSYIIDKRISFPLLISGTVLCILGFITIMTGNSTYIKMKATIANMIFGGVLLFGVLRDKGLIQHVFGSAIKMPNHLWIVLSKRFCYYFFCMALINEIVWRNFDEAFWVNFKLFGFVPLTIVFVLSQMPFLYKNQIKDDKDSQE